MNVLVLGGTQFVGRHIVEAFLAAGHKVSILTRGKSADELPAQVERLQGDRNQGPQGLLALTDRQWDACVDVSGYTPGQVRASAELLRDRISQYVFISTVSVYAEPGRHPVREDDPLMPPAAEDVTEVTGETYGPLKVACERIVQDVYAENCAILRPQIVAGPYDHTARYPYWVDRASRGGEMLAPGDGSDHVQVIDARDQARFTVKVAEEKISGVFNLAGPRLSWSDFLEVLGAAQPHWVSYETLQSHGLGHRDLPLYLPEHSEQGGLMDVSPERALAAGLIHTAPSVTAADTRAWSQTAELSYALTPEREKEVLGAVARTS
ncbi:NAD-dependent epimerase/dehydratase family protein [Deinococcus deserti]|uniref:UDP-glucose 4-epimerase n=1 Tax=Deinococcus deserti (strain DSM 17065 / CIP 109153 / LMG 22923 / VCD115) TaxID=546414 RepID=C1D0C0_DEIDV|nr:NAD-dependent epimerase/dehydratase family protein [Deinococcus deserti]ACO47389.1 putative NAD dependent epimerase/dehydratase [Deinococcus deserti VCD115]